MIINLDFETRSAVDLPTHGLDRYAKDQSTQVICMAYSVDGEPVELWTPGAINSHPLPLCLFNKDAKFQAWNAAFEYNILKHVLGLQIRWEQMIDSMAIAAANNIPQSLEEAAIFLGTIQQKDAAGKRLIMKLSKPQKDGTFNKDPELLKQMYQYCIQDVKTEMDIVKNLRALSDTEQSVWVLTQQINEEGVSVDPREIKDAVEAVRSAQEAVDAECVALTGCKASERTQLLGWLNSKGADLANLTAETVEAQLAKPDLNPQIRRALELRQEGSQTSTAKYAKMEEIQENGRIRNLFVYHGASTGRWASRGGLNLQNLPRPQISDEAVLEVTGRVLEQRGSASITELSSIVRSVIKAPEGQMFLSADFSSIENRVGVWIPGQKDKVEMFRKGMDEYKVFASQALYRVPYEEVTKDMRQVSKSAVLGCLFGQGSKGLVKYAEGMGVKLGIEQAEVAVKKYRESYALVKACWYQLEDLAIKAIQNPGMPFGLESGKIVFKVANDVLWMRLPSGRLICWRNPEIEDQLTPWGSSKVGITVRNQNTYTRVWGRNKLIGPTLFQNAVQATARDLLAHSMLNLKSKGFNIIATVHDELLVLDKEDRLEEMVAVMTQQPSWALDIPLAAEGWVGLRYRK